MTISFKIYYENGALNSKPVLDALSTSITQSGNKLVTSDEDVVVLWSALWHGRMANNKLIYESAKLKNKIIMFVEVGNLNRGHTWRISLDNVNARGYFGNTSDLDMSRPSKINCNVLPQLLSRRKEILIAGQHEKSLQWDCNKSYSQWLQETINEIRKYTDMPITFRHHPRANYINLLHIKGITFETPKKITNSYDNFNFDNNYHCIINYNSGPSVQSALLGTPVICNNSSLAYTVSNKLCDIENLIMPDRTDWAVALSHTEWTITEIINGIPLARLMSEIYRRIKI